MSQSEQKQTSSATIKYWPLLGLFTIGTILVSIVLGLLELALLYFNINSSSRYMTTFIVAAYLGYRHMKRFGERPPKYFFWKFNTLIFTVFSVILVPVSFALVSKGKPDDMFSLATTNTVLLMLVITYFLHLLGLVIGWRIGEKTFVRWQAALQSAKSKG